MWSAPNFGGADVALDRAGYPVVLGGVTADVYATKLHPTGQGSGLWSIYINAEASVTAYALAIDSSGNLVAVWQSTDSLGDTVGSDWDIFVSHSTDNGSTWTWNSWAM